MSKRQTGRTQRLLEAAIDRAKAGEYVFVMAADAESARQLQKRCSEMCDGKIAGEHKVYVGKGQISFETSDNPQFNFDRLSMAGAFPTCKLFVDHYAIERRYGRILDEWQRFDVKP